VSVARFIASHPTVHGIPDAVACRALDVSESWFYKWHDRPPTDRQRRREQLTDAIRVVFEASGKTYGSPRIGLELRAGGWQVSDNTIAAIMAEKGWSIGSPRPDTVWPRRSARSPTGREITRTSSPRPGNAGMSNTASTEPNDRDSCRGAVE
jgi:hypothetical protein